MVVMMVVVVVVIVIVVVIHVLDLGRGESDGLAMRRVEVGAAPGFDPVLQRPSSLGRFFADQPLERTERGLVVSLLGIRIADLVPPPDLGTECLCPFGGREHAATDKSIGDTKDFGVPGHREDRRAGFRFARH